MPVHAANTIPIPGSFVGSPHRYRIEWTAAGVTFFVDGVQVDARTGTFGQNMRPAASDFASGGPELSVDWMRMSPYPACGTFDSRVFDAGVTADWGALNWTADTPAGTGVAISVRTGNTPTPDGSWTGFTPIANGGSIGANARYVQYRAQLTTATRPHACVDRRDGDYAPGQDRSADDHPADSGAERDRRAAGQNVSVQFSEPMNPATINGSTIRLRKQGAGSDVPASVSYSGNTATLDPNADLDPSAVYQVTVAGTVEDANGNLLGTDDTWTFTTAGQVFGFTDTTVADFGAGTPETDTYVSGDRQRRGDPEADRGRAEFSGALAAG